ncbi:hypothetical protein [Spiroplasma sp. AdecLV25b]|uniref:hypothetical protein n=1 Tax=Spiroplasma sp. AdecLV25b TaxID=3027162 RepID=UPI0027E069E4|nr:hypothetical protein [Spiroplasma sp. AdecLV25b]
MKHFKIKKSWFISIFTTFCSAVLLTSTFLIILVMEKAFNVIKFNPNLPEQSIVVDMNKIDIHASDKSLRLLYFEEKVINQSFQELLTNVLRSQNILPSTQDKYDFIFYSQDGSEGIDNSLSTKQWFS